MVWRGSRMAAPRQPRAGAGRSGTPSPLHLVAALLAFISTGRAQPDWFEEAYPTVSGVLLRCIQEAAVEARRDGDLRREALPRRQRREA
jgi:hypothetical protein